jgi:hypothetical protein
MAVKRRLPVLPGGLQAAQLALSAHEPSPPRVTCAS